MKEVDDVCGAGRWSWELQDHLAVVSTLISESLVQIFLILSRLMSFDPLGRIPSSSYRILFFFGSEEEPDPVPPP